LSSRGFQMDLTVKNVCQYLGINQKELANLTGYSVDTISKWNRGVNKIPKSAENHFKLLLERNKYQKIDTLLNELNNLTKQDIFY
jgi:DNA-binding transcriptional regulator YiaG